MALRFIPGGLDSETHHEDAESIQDQLIRLERIALAAGLFSAAQWVRDNHAHATVWVEDGKGDPELMFSWLAKERKLEPITCAICDHVATEVDSLYPYHRERSRCAAHIRD